jgi:hypothetical protein
MSKLTDSIKTWHMMVAAILITAALATGIKTGVEAWLMPRAEASQAIEELIWRELRDVREQLRKQKIYRAQVASDEKINQSQKTILLAEIEVELEELAKEEACLEAGRLRCN